MNKLFTVLGGKLKFSAHDSDMEYSCWQCKYSSVSSDLKPPLSTRLHVTGLPKKQTDKFEVFFAMKRKEANKTNSSVRFLQTMN